MYTCFNCLSHNVGWVADYDFDDLGFIGSGIVHRFKCRDCGATIECIVRFDADDDEVNENDND